MRALFLVACFCGVSLIAAQADATVVFNLRSQDFSDVHIGAPFIQEDPVVGNGVKLTITGDSGSKKAASVNQTGLGTGVFTERKGEGFKIGKKVIKVDPVDRGETLSLSFSKPFRIDALCFTFADERNDKIIITDASGTQLFKGVVSSGLAFTSLPFSQVFNLTAPKGSDWFVTSVKGEVIPEPSTLLIWSGLGIGALVWRRRKMART